MDHPWTLFHLLFGLFKATVQILQQVNDKKSPSADADIQTHNLLNLILLP